MNRYRQLLDKLFALNPGKERTRGLENALKLNALLGQPASAFPAIHIAGTNGKGSVTAKVAKGLESKFSRVGAFTSPHISCFRERIAINGKLISEQDTVRILARLFEAAEKADLSCTFFEIATLLAFAYFAEQKIDIGVLETGLGGRLDPTNIANPVLSIITSIDFDHTELLGDTLESIAFEKSGIIKEGIPVILGPTASIIPTHLNSPVKLINKHFDHVEEENRAIARAALEHLGIQEAAIRKALTTKLPCRREKVFFQNRELILDVSHNPAGLARLFSEMKIPKERLRVICGLSKSKDLDTCLAIIQENAQHIHLIDASNERCADPELLNQILIKQGVAMERIRKHATINHCVEEALLSAKKLSQEIIVCGTFFIMSPIRSFLGIEEPEDL